jgi:N-acetylmuramoyl-L-alanine amidase
MTNAWIPLAHWSERVGLSLRPRSATNSVITLGGLNTTLSLRVGSRAATCNQTEFWLGFAPQILNGIAQIHSLDARKTLEPLLKGYSQQLTSRKSIAIDAGHGGRDPGTRSALNQLEKAYTLDWARRLQTLLLLRGWTVTMTRTNDTEVSLADRVLQAEQSQADLFLSLHFNSGPPTVHLAGIETYCLTPVGVPSNLLRAEEDNLSMWPNNTFDAQNVQLGWQLHRTLIQHTRALDRGIRRARFMTVLRGQNRPAVLIEGGYLSNVAEAKKIATPAYRQLLAEAIANALEPSPF